MKPFTTIVCITLSVFTSHVFADGLGKTFSQGSKSYYIDPFVQGANIKKAGGCGMRYPAQPQKNASTDAKYDALMASAMNCDYMHDTTRANNFRTQAANCKEPPTQKGNSDCKTSNNTTMVFITGTCTPKPKEQVNATSCDYFYKQSFACSRAVEGVPASGITGDMSLGMGCAQPRK